MIVPKPTVCFGTDSNLFLIVVITLILIPIALEWKRICFTNGDLSFLIGNGRNEHVPEYLALIKKTFVI